MGNSKNRDIAEKIEKPYFPFRRSPQALEETSNFSASFSCVIPDEE